MKIFSKNVYWLWVVALLVLLSTNVFALTTPSVISQFGTPKTDTAYAVAVDGDGNIFTAGDTLGTTFDGLASNGGQDGFLRKTDSTGKLLWTVLIGTPVYDEIRSLAVDADGNAYVCGTTLGTGFGGLDMFVAKVSPTGTILWFNQDGTSVEDSAQSITLDAAGNVYVAGWTKGTMDASNPNLKAKYFAVVAKYSPTGSKVWIKQFNNSIKKTVDNFAYAVTFYNDRIYVTGLSRTSELGNLFLYVFDLNGNVIWTRSLGSENSYGRAVAVDASGVYVAGSTISAFDGNPLIGGYDSIIIKYDLNGNKLWSKLWGTPAWEYTNGITVDSSGNVYVVGMTLGALDSQKSFGSYDIFVTKYSPVGTKLYTAQTGTIGVDYCYSVALDKVDNIHIAGSTQFMFTGQKNYGGYDAYVAVYPSETEAAFTTMTVLDQNTLAPLADALVTAYDANNVVIGASMTDIKGKTYFKTKKTAKLVTTKDKNGYVSVVNPETLALNYGFNKFTSYMVPSNVGFQATLTVLDKLTNKPVSGAVVNITDVNKGFVGNFISNANGIITCTMKFAGKTSITVTKTGYTTLTETYILNPGSKSGTVIYISSSIPSWNLTYKKSSQVFTLPVDCTAYWFIQTVTKNGAYVTVSFMLPDSNGYARDMYSNNYIRNASGGAGCAYSTNANVNVILKANTKYFINSNRDLSITNWDNCMLADPSKK